MLVRRIIAVILAIWFLVALTATFLLWRVNSTVLNPEYVKATLSSDADYYNFLYDDVLPVLVEDALANSQDRLSEDLADLRFTPEEDTPAFVGLISDVMPREELQARVELAVDEILPWVTGDTDTVNVSLRLNELVDEVPDALERRMAELGFGDRVVDSILAPMLGDALNGIDVGTLDLSVSPETARQMAQEIAPGEWLEEQIVTATGEISGWLTRETDSFEVRVHYAERIPDATNVIKDVLDDSNVEDYLFDTVIAPEVKKAIGVQRFLGGDVIISDEEVNQAIERVAPREWVREQRNVILDTMSRYLSGQDDELFYSVDMSERREATVNAIADLGEEKLLQVVNTVPACTTREEAAEAFQLAQRGVLPDCLGQQLERSLLDAAITDLSSTLRGDVNDQIGANLPETIVVDEPFLEATAGAEVVVQLRELRRLTREGFVFTDEDLVREMTSPGSGTTVEDIELMRDVLSEDYTITERDLLDRVGPAFGNEEAFETSRKYFGWFRGLWWLIFSIPGLLLAAVFFLGGRTWSGRIAWAAGTLVVTAAILWIAVWQGFQVYGLDQIQTEFDEEIQRALDDQTLDVTFKPIVVDAYGRVVRTVDLWVGGYSDTARNTFIGSLLVFGLAILWHFSTEGSRVRSVGDTLGGSATTAMGRFRSPRPTSGGSAAREETGAYADRDADATRAPVVESRTGTPQAATRVGGPADGPEEADPKDGAPEDAAGDESACVEALDATQVTEHRTNGSDEVARPPDQNGSVDPAAQTQVTNRASDQAEETPEEPLPEEPPEGETPERT